MEINFVNVLPKYQTLIKKTAAKFQESFHLNPQAVTSIEFVSKSKIRGLNQKYRRLDKPTDVLSFPIWQNLKDVPKRGKINLGDIFICPEMTNIDTKLDALVWHSLNHLVGKHH